MELLAQHPRNRHHAHPACRGDVLKGGPALVWHPWNSVPGQAGCQTDIVIRIFVDYPKRLGETVISFENPNPSHQDDESNIAPHPRCLCPLSLLASAAIITDISNVDGATVSAIDGTTGAEDIDSAAVNSTALATVNANVDYVISNWGSSTWDNGSNTLQNVFGTLDVTISETITAGDGKWSPNATTANRATTGTSHLAANFSDNVSFTIDFSEAVDTAGFVVTNLGAAYDGSSNGSGLTAIFYTGAGGTGTILSTQTWSNGGAETNGGDDGGQADAYFGLSGATAFLSIVIDIQRNGNTGTGGVGLDDLGFGVVPEPSTYALFAGALALGCVMIRRRLRA